MNNEQLTSETPIARPSAPRMFSAVHCSLFVVHYFIACCARNPRRHSPLRDSPPAWPLFRGNPPRPASAPTRFPTSSKSLWKVRAGDSVESTAAIVKGRRLHRLARRLRVCPRISRTASSVGSARPGADMKARSASTATRCHVGDSDSVFHSIDRVTEDETLDLRVRRRDHRRPTSPAPMSSSAPTTRRCSDLEHQDGKVVWSFKTKGPVNGSAVIAGDRTFVAGCDGDLCTSSISKTGKESAIPSTARPARPRRSSATGPTSA